MSARLILCIPPTVPVDDRRKALARAKQEFHRAKMLVGTAIRNQSIPELRHAKKALKRARVVVRAWSAVQRTGEAA